MMRLSGIKGAVHIGDLFFRDDSWTQHAGGSFNGRTTDSDSVNPGSNPGPSANTVSYTHLTLPTN